uniref:Uncharacterized protein n=1 Tax=Gasterosteus aculeatus aculeatus TaxID=481459 RepID=A0AAQ4RPW8_GASAC
STTTSVSKALALFLSLSFSTTPPLHVRYIEKKTLLCSNWVGLGILSSVGLGTDTFLLYLVRTIVTLAAYECGSVDFPESPYPDQIVCSLQNAPALGSHVEQVGVEAAWGAGTAIGELPPYFMARAARMSDHRFEEILDQTLDFVNRGKVAVQKLIQRVGFFGILACASFHKFQIHCFDLAGITSTLEKAVIKMHIQVNRCLSYMNS